MKSELLPPLVDCVESFLETLVTLYSQGYIDYDFFESCAKAKIAFLKNNLDNIRFEKEKKKVMNILSECDKILSINSPV